MTLAFLASATVRVSVVLLAALLAAAALVRRPAALRSHVLATAVCGALLVPLLTISLPSWHLRLADVASPAPSYAEAAGDIRTSSGTVIARPETATGPSTTSHNVALRRASFISSLPGMLVLTWTLGVAFGLSGLLVGWLRLVMLSRRATPVESGPWFDLLRSRVAEDRACRRVRVLVSGHPTLLVAWGWRQPRILIPADALTWQEDRVAIVVDHELAHVRRGDWLLQMAGELVRTLGWFNPIAWLAVSRLRLESERACDDEVIARGTAPSDYAQHLVALARTLAGSRTWIPAPAMARVSSLERRVNAMLDHQVARAPSSRILRLSVVSVGLALTASIASFAAQSQFATVNGTVHDQLGGTLPKVTLRLTHALSGARHEITSSDLGRFEFVGLPPGNYTLDTYAAGFKTLQQTLQLAGGQTLRQDLRLEVGTLQETIMVRDGPPAPVTVRPRRTDTATSMACTAEPNSGRLKPPLKTDDTRARYPESMRGTGIAGRVEMQAIIGLDGAVKTVRTVNATNDDFAQAAAGAVRQWKFTPTLLSCVPVEVEMNVLTVFTPEGAAPPPPPPPPPPPAPPAQR